MTFEQQFSEVWVMLTDSRLVFHADSKYVFTSDQIKYFLYLTLKICKKKSQILEKINKFILIVFGIF